MSRKSVNTFCVKDGNIKWFAQQDDEYPILTIIHPDVEIDVQVEINSSFSSHNQKYLKGLESSPLSDDIAELIVKKVVESGYIEKYQKSDIGLIFDSNGNLIEN